MSGDGNLARNVEISVVVALRVFNFHEIFGFVELLNKY